MTSSCVNQRKPNNSLSYCTHRFLTVVSSGSMKVKSRVNMKNHGFLLPSGEGRRICFGSARSLQWCHNERDGVSNHRRLDRLLNPLFRSRSKKTSKLRVTGLCEWNSPVTGGFPSQRSSDAENVFIWWRHYACCRDRDLFRGPKGN